MRWLLGRLSTRFRVYTTPYLFLSHSVHHEFDRITDNPSIVFKSCPYIIAAIPCGRFFSRRNNINTIYM